MRSSYSPDAVASRWRFESRDGASASPSATKGIGHRAARAAADFGKFYRVDPWTGRGVGGTGLGL